MDLTISISDSINLSQELLWPVVYIPEAFAYTNDTPVTLYPVLACTASGTTTAIRSTQFFVGQSFTGDGRKLYGAVFNVGRSATAPTPSTAKIYARLYSHSGTLGSSSVTNTLLETSTNYYTVSQITAVITSSNGRMDLLFNFAGTTTLTNGTNYVIGLHSSEITSTNYITVYFGAVSSDAYPVHPGNIATISSGGATAANSSGDLCFAVLGAPSGWGHHSFVSGVPGAVANDYSIRFSYNGLNVYGTEETYQYSLSRPYEISSSGSSVFIANGPSSSVDFVDSCVSLDGKMYFTMTVGGVLTSYTLATPYNIGSYVAGSAVTREFLGLFMTPAPPTSNVAAFMFSTSGDRLYVVGAIDTASSLIYRMYQFNLSKPWDISTITEGDDILTTKLSSTTQYTVYPIYGGSGTMEVLGQSFSIPSTATITRMDLSIGGQTVPTDNLYIEIASGSIDGTTIATSTTNPSALGSANGDNGYNDGTWAPFFFPGGISLTGSITYYIRILRDGSRSTVNYPLIEGNAPGGTNITTGTLYKKESGVWTSYASDDILVKIYSGEIPMPDAFFDVTVDAFNDQAAGYYAQRARPGYFSPDGKYLFSMTTQYSYSIKDGSLHTILYKTELGTPWEIDTATSTTAILIPRLSTVGETSTGFTMSADGSRLFWRENYSYGALKVNQLSYGSFQPFIGEDIVTQEDTTESGDLGNIDSFDNVTITEDAPNIGYFSFADIWDDLLLSSGDPGVLLESDIHADDVVNLGDPMAASSGQHTPIGGIYRPRATFGKNEAIHAKITASGGKLVDPRGGQSQYSHNQGGSL